MARLMEIKTLGVVVPVSQELLDDAAALRADWERWQQATPEQRQQWKREARERRAAERAQHPPVPLTLDALLDTLGYTREYATHLVQPYCSCGDSADGWDLCPHADDLGLRP